MCRVLLLAALLVAAVQTSAAAEVGRRDVLFDIVTHCLTPGGADYCTACRAPRIDSGCVAQPECRKSTEIWAMNEQFVAMRDQKMCGCPAGFVHGLVLPRQQVRGVEDPARPDGIWQFAWDVGRKHMPAESLALVVNPAHARGQDQLHVHLLKLDPKMAQDLAAKIVGQVHDLNQVWAVAAKAAAEREYPDYGVLVAAGPDGTFRVAVSVESPEALFTVWSCN